MLNVVETFSGIGSQAEALKNIHVDHSIVATVEWEVGALYAYDIIHHGKQYLADYRLNTKEALVKELSKFNLSNTGKAPMLPGGLRRMSLIQLQAIHAAIERSNNKIDITGVTANDLPENVDVLTYSFPCQDLSIAGIFHHNEGGIDRDANNRSSLLWQIERILKEYSEIGKSLPRFLLMENVSAILSPRHIDNFKMWQQFLESFGYVNHVYTLNAKNFGIPQSRQRTYMVSVLADNELDSKTIEQYFFENDLEIYQAEKNIPLEEILKLDYNNIQYRVEAMKSSPNFTPSRERILKDSKILATDQAVFESLVNTLTTKQDRSPNSGIITYDKFVAREGTRYRNLTPRECFILMGFKEESFDLLMENNIYINKSRRMLGQTKLLKLAGNSIVVPVLEQIFLQMDEINSLRK